MMTWDELAAVFNELEEAGFGPVIVFGKSRVSCWIFMWDGVIIGPLSIPKYAPSVHQS